MVITTVNVLYSIWPAAASHKTPSKTAAFARENWQAITAKFGAFQTNVCQKLLKNGVGTEQLRLFVANQFPPGDFIPPPPASLTEIFEAVTTHRLWDCLHYSPLVHIVKTFGPSDPEMKDWVQSYQRDLKAYQIITKVEDYIEADLGTADSPPANCAKNDPRYCCPVEWKTNFIDHSLDYLAEVWELFSCNYLVPDCPPTALLDRVRKGCLVVTWLVPSGLIELLIKRANIETDFFQQHRILKVTVGDKCVYEDIAGGSMLVSSSLASFPGLGTRLVPLWSGLVLFEVLYYCMNTKAIDVLVNSFRRKDKMTFFYKE